MLGGVVFSTLRTPTCRGRHRALQPAAIERVIWIGSKSVGVEEISQRQGA